MCCRSCLPLKWGQGSGGRCWPARWPTQERWSSTCLPCCSACEHNNTLTEQEGIMLQLAALPAVWPGSEWDVHKSNSYIYMWDFCFVNWHYLHYLFIYLTYLFKYIHYIKNTVLAWLWLNKLTCRLKTVASQYVVLDVLVNLYCSMKGYWCAATRTNYRAIWQLHRKKYKRNKYKRNTFVFAPILHELNSKI